MLQSLSAPLHPDLVAPRAIWPQPEGSGSLCYHHSCPGAVLGPLILPRPPYLWLGPGVVYVSQRSAEECCRPAVVLAWSLWSSVPVQGLRGWPPCPGLEIEAMEAEQPHSPGMPTKNLWLLLHPDLTLVPPQAAVTKAQPSHPSRRPPGQRLTPEAARPEAAEATSGRHPTHRECSLHPEPTLTLISCVLSRRVGGFSQAW